MKFVKKNTVALLLLVTGISLSLRAGCPCGYCCCSYVTNKYAGGAPAWATGSCGTQKDREHSYCQGTKKLLGGSEVPDSDWDSSTKCPRGCC